MPHRRRALQCLRAASMIGVALAATLAPTAPASATPLTTAAPATAAVQPAAVTCRPAVGFSRVGSGALFRLQDDDVLTGSRSLTEIGQVGHGWTGSAFAWTGTGGDGVLYGLTWAGALKWYRYDVQASAWVAGSGRTVATGLVPRTRIANIALGGDGQFYVVRADHQLVLYTHTGRLTGAATWGNTAGWVIGTGWSGTEVLIPNGDGTLYRQYGGSLYWYHHSDPRAGRVTWSARRTIGTGWRFYDVLSAGAGVLYATQGGTGLVSVFRNGDPDGGSAVWQSGAGLPKYTARPDSFGVAIDPLACATA